MELGAFRGKSHFFKNGGDEKGSDFSRGYRVVGSVATLDAPNPTFSTKGRIFDSESCRPRLKQTFPRTPRVLVFNYIKSIVAGIAGICPKLAVHRISQTSVYVEQILATFTFSWNRAVLFSRRMRSRRPRSRSRNCHFPSRLPSVETSVMERRT